MDRIIEAKVKGKIFLLLGKSFVCSGFQRHPVPQKESLEFSSLDSVTFAGLCMGH